LIEHTVLHRDEDRGSKGSGNREPRRGGPPRGTPPRRPPLQGGRPFRTLAFWAFVALLSLVAFRMYQGSFMAPQRIEISYTRFMSEVEKGNIQDLQIIEKLVTGDLRGESTIKIGTHEVPFKAFKTNILGDGSDLPERVWKTNPGIEIEVRNPSFNWVSVLVGWLPVVFVLVLWLFMVRQVQSGGSAALKFGKTKARVLLESTPKVTFKDVAGCDEAKQELQEVIEFLKEPQKFQRLGGRIPKGALLLGPPGSGKTLLAKAVAGEAGVPFFSMSGSDFVEMFVGVGASVTGDTPVLIRQEGATRLTSIGEFVDGFYQGEDEGRVVPVEGVETLGFEERDSKFKGSTKTFVKGSAWSRVRGVYRHRVSEICEIEYLGGVIRATSDHSVFVRTRDGIKPVAASELRSGDVLVRLQEPPQALSKQETGQVVGSAAMRSRNATGNTTLAEPEVAVGVGLGMEPWHSPAAGDAVVLGVHSKPYDGYVYDLCGCDNEAFFGGEQPVLLHNSRVRDLFEQGKRNAPCILFVDEIDAVGRHRGAGLGGGHDEREQTLNQLLVEMDGFESNEGVIMIAATNRPDVLDPALLRPGRFDRQIVVDWPDVRGREGILRVHTRKIPLADDVDLKLIARGTPGLAGADLANIVNESALLAARRNRKKVTLRDFEDAKDKVMLGMERRSLVMTEDERRSTAYHEAGHALVGWLLPGSDPVNKVTIIPRGRALGITSWVPQEERHNRSREDLERMLGHMMGGRAAELLVFNHLTTGAISDIEQATETARNMVCRYGMSDALGPLTFGRKEEMVFLGKEIATHKDYSEQTAVLIDQEVRRIVETAYNAAMQVLRDNMDKLHLLANTLLEREVLDGDEMDRVLRGEKLEPLRPAVEPELTTEAATSVETPPASAVGEKIETFPPPAPRPAGA
jgi:ATP-dependent metalloprotease FtsH